MAGVAAGEAATAVGAVGACVPVDGTGVVATGAEATGACMYAVGAVVVAMGTAGLATGAWAPVPLAA